MNHPVLFGLLCLAIVALANPQGSGKIIGGEEAKLGQFPFIISLQISASKHHLCGGGLISETIVLSAAHCFAGTSIAKPTDIIAYVGSNDLGGNGTYLNIKRIVLHEDFNRNGLVENDIALLELAEPAPLGPNVATIKLPKANTVVPDGTPAVALGWGTIGFPNLTYPDHLNYMPVNIIDQQKCQAAYGIMNEILDSQVCVGGEMGRGLCFGDSGSPLVLNGDTSIGIVSYGQPPCGTGTPDVFTATASFINWIEKASATL